VPPSGAALSVERSLLALPKVDIHLHLEGAIRPDTLLEIADRDGTPALSESCKALAIRQEDTCLLLEVALQAPSLSSDGSARERCAGNDQLDGAVG